MEIDHMILPVNDRDASVAFYEQIIGCTYEGESEPFSVVRVSPTFTLQLAPWGTGGNMHIALAMPRAQFDEAFARMRAAGIEYGDSFHSVGNMQGPGDEDGARGAGKAVYCFDPSHHLVEIRHYEP
jgi:catechol 2,3-dioxygenase-like lactoylglutathione lyase family enzyme